MAPKGCEFALMQSKPESLSSMVSFFSVTAACKKDPLVSQNFGMS
jgi:hypothetical protein